MSILATVTKGKVEKPLTMVMYSPEGVGKSTFAANAPNPIFIPCEEGTNHLDVARFPRPTTWMDVSRSLDALYNEKHDYQTVVIDTLDAAEPIVWKHVIDSAKSDKIKSIEDFGFGKGYVAAMEVWRAFLADLDRLRAKGMNVILLAHSVVKTFKSPDVALDPFQRYELKLNGQASGLMKEWPDAVLFANYETTTAEKDKLVRGVSTGQRLIHTVHTAAYDAKNRYSLPATLPLSWQAFEKAARAGTAKQEAGLEGEIQALIVKATKSIADDAGAAFNRANGDTEKLTKLRDWLKTKVA